MSKFTKTLIASTLAVAVAGPAAADVLPFDDTFISNKPLKVKINPANCKNSKFDFATSTLYLYNEYDGEVEDFVDFEGAGFWDLHGFTWADFDPDLFGIFTTRKIDKDLTASIYDDDLGGCVVDEASIDIPGLSCWGLAEVIQTALVLDGCGLMTPLQSNTLQVTKSNIKLSKKGDRAKVDFKVEGEYINTKNNSKAKKVNLTIKGKNYDKVLAN